MKGVNMNYFDTIKYLKEKYYKKIDSLNCSIKKLNELEKFIKNNKGDKLNNNLKEVLTRFGFCRVGLIQKMEK